MKQRLQDYQCVVGAGQLFQAVTTQIECVFNTDRPLAGEDHFRLKGPDHAHLQGLIPEASGDVGVLVDFNPHAVAPMKLSA